MIRALSQAVLSCLVALSGWAQVPQPAAPATTDTSQVIEAMRTMYGALTKDDLAQFRSVAAPDFYAYDGGKRFTAEALVELIRELHAAGNVFVWQVTEPEVRLHGELAWITYVNRGSLRNASGTRPLSWLESAVLRKVDGRWRIAFFHSTRVP